MILGLIKSLSKLLLTPLFAVLSLVVDLSFLNSFLDTVFGYIRGGMGIVNFFVPLNLVLPALEVVFAVYAVRKAYSLFMWIYKKVPFLGAG